MPISTPTSRIQYATNGVTTAFPISFPFFDEDTINAAWSDSTGAVTDLTLTTDFSITGGGGANGTLTTTGALSPLANGGTLTIYRAEPYIQTTEFTDNSPLPADDLNDVADKSTMRDQQLEDLGSRSLSFPVTVNPLVSAELPTPVADAVLAFSSDGLSLEAIAIPSGTAVYTSVNNTRAGTATAEAVTPDSLASLWQEGIPLVSAASIAKPGSGNLGGYYTQSGNTQVDNYWADVKGGIEMEIRYTGTPLLSIAGNILPPGAAAFQVIAGDIIRWRWDASLSEWRVNGGMRADGTALVAAASATLIGSARNLVIKTNASTPNSKADLSADEVALKDASGNPKLFSAVAVTIDITASGANGLDTGSEASGTWYYVWGVGKSDGTFAGLFSASSTAPTLPSGYTYKALLGVVRNDGSSNFIKFHQADRDVETAPVVAITGTAVSVAGTLQTLSISSIVPPNAKRVHGTMGWGANGPGDMAVAGDANGVGRRQYGADQTAGSVLDGLYGAGSFVNVPLITAQAIFWTAFDTSTNPIIKVSGYTL